MTAMLSEQWPTKRLRYLTSRVSSDNKRGRLADISDVSFLPMEAIGEHGQLDLSVTRPIDQVQSGYSQFFDGDVVIAKITPCFENGKGALIRSTLSGVGFGTTELHVLTPGHDLDGKFLYYLTIDSRFRQLGAANMTGAAGQQRVPGDFIRDLKVRVPPILQQRSIADYLDHETARLDALVVAKERVLALLAEKRQALIARAVTRGLDPDVQLREPGVPWLGKVPSHWKLVPLKHGFNMIGSGTTPPTGEGAYYDGDVPWVTTSELRENIITTTNQHITPLALDELTALRIYPIGSVLFAMYGATIGRVGLLGIEATVNQAVCVLAYPCLLDSRFAFYALQASRSDLVSSAFGGGQPNLNAERVREHRVACPPMTEQESIVTHIEIQLTKLENLRNATMQMIALLRERRSSLISEAVTGRINLEGAS